MHSSVANAEGSSRTDCWGKFLRDHAGQLQNVIQHRPDIFDVHLLPLPSSEHCIWLWLSSLYGSESHCSHVAAMSATLLANELANLISESKRKNNDLRNAAEKALSDLKSLTVTSEQQLAADLSRRPAFPEPFLIACQTRNARFASSGVVCLQRLVISRSLARARLGEALDAFNACSDLGLDLQLKVLQALPSLVQNYADDLKGDLLASTLQVCSSLQAAKTPTVSGVAAATLQQLVSSVFEKVAAENAHAAEIPPIAEVPGSDGPIAVRPAAHDAYRIFRDLILAAEDRKTRFVDFSSLPTESALELIYSCIETNSYLVKHEAFTGIIRSNVLPFVIQALSEKLVFSVTVRCVRILGTILCKHMARFPGECETALGLIAHGLDSDSAPIWKRTLFMEVLRTFFKDQSLVIAAYMAFDLSTDGKPEATRPRHSLARGTSPSKT